MVGYKDHKTYGDSTIYELDGRKPTNKILSPLRQDNERKSRTYQWLGSNARSSSSNGILCYYRTTHLVFGDKEMLALASGLLFTWVVCPVSQVMMMTMILVGG